MSIGEQTSYMAADLLEMPDGERYELVGGQLVERKMGAESSWIAGRIHSRLDAFVEQQGAGWAFPEGTSYQCFPDDRERVRKPDASFIARGRLPGDRPPRGHIPVAPDLAVEVVSPIDLYYEVEQKVHEYLEAGVKLVWVLNPDTRALRIHRADGSPSDLRETDAVSGEDVLPGFECRVAEFLVPRE